MDVDFSNKRVVFGIYSDNAEPFSNGFYYLHIDVNIPCMTAPSIVCASGSGSTQYSQTTNLLAKMYRHVDLGSTPLYG